MHEIFTQAEGLGALTQSAHDSGLFISGDGKPRHVMTARIYYEDTDFSGFVYHANYLKMAERGRSNFLRLAGVTHSALLALEPPLAFVVGHMDMEFVNPARIDDRLLIETAFTTLRGARLVAEQRIRRGDEAIWQAHMVAACVDLQGRPRRMPKDVMGQLAPYEGMPFLDAAPRDA